MYEYLNDQDFLTSLDKLNLRVQYAKITLLTFDEQVKEDIQGTITSGSLNVNGSSRVRRTLSLSMLVSQENKSIDDIDNQISLNRKIYVHIGYKNPLRSYEKYGDIIWFPCGLFIISSANVQRTTSGWSISISGKDKMCLLDGSVGGTLSASTTFNERWIALDNGDYEIEYPTIFQIIYEAVNHWGGEAIENIVITDIDEEVRMLVKYVGELPIYFDKDFTSVSFTQTPTFEKRYSYGDDVGYEMTPFTYPGELILKAGDTVVTLLDKIVSTLGNYEYYYDINGRFIFQQIKNYLNTGSPMTELTQLGVDNYVKNYNNAKFIYALTDLDTTTSITQSPKYDNFKNDFYVWGQRETPAGVKMDIRYHLAIDEKPRIDLAKKNMWEIKDEATNLIIRYDFTEPDETQHTVAGLMSTLIGKPCDEWREELYRRALVAQVTDSVYDNYYDSELLAEWRNLYNPNDWDATNHWNPIVFTDPKNINFWLDFIDTNSALGKYSIKQIGRRTKVLNSQDCKTVYNAEVPDIIFVRDITKVPQNTGEVYFQLEGNLFDMFTISSTGVSCFDKIRELMYQNLCYNTTITLSCLPKYYIEPNNIIYIHDNDTGIDGNYLIIQFSLPLSYNGTMSITATEVLTRV